MKRFLLLASLIGLSACGQSDDDPQDLFFERLSTLCGQSFAGSVVSTDEADADWRSQTMVMHVRDCSTSEIRIPLHVGEDRSRTWIITRGDGILTLKHDHRHEDGSEDVLTQYGGTTADVGTPMRQSFPADQFSKDLFTREGIPVSNDNVWAIEVTPGVSFAYELSRPNRFFRAEFDLSAPAETPPPAWGSETQIN